MLAAHFETNTHPPAMVDDSMEISSEYGHHASEDIDIDIDFVTAPVDEDYAIEDATHDAGFADGLQPQPSPLIGNDDLMIDEDQGSYVMGDADTALDDGDPKVDQEAPTMSFAMGDSSTFNADDHVENGTIPEIPEIPPTVEAEFTWEEQEPSNPATDENAVHFNESEQLISQGGEFPASSNDNNTQEVEEVETFTALPSEPDLGTTISQNKSPHSGPLDGPESPATSVSDRPVEISSNNASENLTSELKQPAPGADQSTIFVSNEPNSFIVAPEVFVSYMSAEYALFAKSESDDPDSYFLSDTSVLEKSLGDFFIAIRDVVQGELSDDDELCMSVRDLGLEIEENSTLAQQASLGQIINLHYQILRNDGVESHRPLYMTLCARSHFLKKLANLTAGAAEGKGLAELVTWDDDGEDVDNSEIVDENTDDAGQHPDEKINNGAKDVEPVEATDHFGVESNRGSLTPTHVNDEQENAETTEPIEGNRRVDAEPIPAHFSKNTSQTDEVSETPLSTKDETIGGEHVENEEDLIDYSDEEEQEEQADRSSGSAVIQTVDDETQDAEDTLREQPHENSSRDADDAIRQQHQTDEAALAEYNEDNVEVLEIGDEHGEAEDLTTEDILGTTEPQTYDDVHTGHDDPEEYLEQEDDSHNEFPPEESTYVEESDYYNVGDETEVDITATVSYERQSHSYEDPAALNGSSSNFDVVDTAESSVTMIADNQHHGEDVGGFDLEDSKETSESHTLDNSTTNGANEEDEDEINYEDDADEKEQTINVPSSPLPKADTSPASNSKRSRGDEETDDILQNKEPKRSRS